MSSQREPEVTAAPKLSSAGRSSSASALHRLTTAVRQVAAPRGGSLDHGPNLTLGLLGVSLLALLQVVVTHALTSPNSGDRPLDWLAYTVLVGGPLALLLARPHPLLPLLVITPLVLAYGALDYRIGPVGLAYGISLTLAGAQRQKYAARASATVVIGALVLAGTTGLGTDLGAPAVVGISAWVTVAAVLGEQIRARRDALSARRLASDAEGRRRQSEDRLALARDLHDALAHSLSVINVQASVALHVMDEAPDEVRPALEVIKTTSKQTLEEVRAALLSLRTRGEGVPAYPVGKVSDLQAIERMAYAGGLALDLQVSGVDGPLPVSVDVAGFRIVQEALTNVVKHSTSTAVAVSVNCHDGSLLLSVTDPGPRRSPTPLLTRGQGLLGMKERAAELGGTVHAGPEGSGFVVRAAIPCPTTAGGAAMATVPRS